MTNNAPRRCSTHAPPASKPPRGLRTSCGSCSRPRRRATDDAARGHPDPAVRGDGGPPRRGRGRGRARRVRCSRISRRYLRNCPKSRDRTGRRSARRRTAGVGAGQSSGPARLPEWAGRTLSRRAGTRQHLPASGRGRKGDRTAMTATGPNRDISMLRALSGGGEAVLLARIEPDGALSVDFANPSARARCSRSEPTRRGRSSPATSRPRPARSSHGCATRRPAAARPVSRSRSPAMRPARWPTCGSNRSPRPMPA